MKGVKPAETASINSQGSPLFYGSCRRKFLCPRGRGTRRAGPAWGLFLQSSVLGWEPHQDPAGAGVGPALGGGVSLGSETQRERVSRIYLQVALQDRGCAPGAGLPSARAPARGGAGAGRGLAAAVSMGSRETSFPGTER